MNEDICVYTCKTGYLLIGNNVRMCQCISPESELLQTSQVVWSVGKIHAFLYSLSSSTQ